MLVRQPPPLGELIACQKVSPLYFSGQFVTKCCDDWMRGWRCSLCRSTGWLSEKVRLPWLNIVAYLPTVPGETSSSLDDQVLKRNSSSDEVSQHNISMRLGKHRRWWTVSVSQLSVLTSYVGRHDHRQLVSAGKHWQIWPMVKHNRIPSRHKV